MKRKLNIKKVLIFLVLLAIFISVIAFKIYDYLESLKYEDIPKVEITEGVVEDSDIPEDVIIVDLSLEKKILSCIVLGEFDNGQNLSTEDYLKVAHSAINGGFIAPKSNYSEAEINNIVYSIFNVELKEHKSVDGLNYENGKYKFEKMPKNDVEITNLEKDAAAGSVYVSFEINAESYFSKVGRNTLTGDYYIQSITKE